MLTTRELQLRLRKRLRRATIVVSSETLQALEAYYRLLSRWNQRINLTALPLDNAPDSTLDRLIVEPLLAARLLPSSTAFVIDVGSGGGSPAIPLRLAVPNLSMVMIESKTRKAVFLREVVRELGLERTVVEAARAEQLLPRPELNEAADVITLRAVRVEARLFKTLQAFLKPGGQVFLFRRDNGPAEPLSVPPPLTWNRSVSLGEGTGASLALLSKLDHPAAYGRH